MAHYCPGDCEQCWPVLDDARYGGRSLHRGTGDSEERWLEDRRQRTAGIGGGTSHNVSYETSLPVVQLGGLTATKVDALAMDLSKLSSALGRPIGGVLGYSLLKTRIVQIDYPNRTVRFYTNAPSCAGAPHSHPPKCTKLSFRYKDDILATGVTVDGKPVTTNVDTGSNSSFQLSPAAVEKLGLSENVARAHASTSVWIQR